jgi:iron complex transport system substrate-binding protein
MLVGVLGFAEGSQENRSWEEPAAKPASGSVLIVDEAGREVEVFLPVRRIACLVPGVAEVLAVLQKDELIVARSSDISFPPRLEKVPDVGNTNEENIELLLEVEPDLVIARAGLLKDAGKEKIERATAAPMLQYRSTDLGTTFPMIRDMGRLLNAEDRAEEFLAFIEEYETLIAERVVLIPDSGKTEVFFQSMDHMYWSGNKESSGHERIVEAGGINIAAEESAKVPRLSAEWVLERDPELIIRSYSGARKADREPTLEEMKARYDEIVTAPGLREVRAARNDRTYVIDVRLITGPRSIIGKLYYAKWISPEYFADIDPEVVHREMMRRFYGIELHGTWVYPE